MMKIKIGKDTRTILSLEECESKVVQLLDTDTWTTSKGKTKNIKEFDPVHIINIYILMMRSYMYHAYNKHYLIWANLKDIESKKSYLYALCDIINTDNLYLQAFSTDLCKKFIRYIDPIMRSIGATNLYCQKFIDPIKTKIK